MQGINLSAPHGELIWQGKKSAIVKPRPFPELVGHHILVSDSMAWGEIEVGGEQSLSAAEFDAHFSEHRVTTKEREKWWPGVDTLYLYPVVSFAPYDRPLPVNVPNGTKTLIKEVQYKEVGEMPYSADNVPKPAKNWSKAAQKKCIAAANAVLRDGGSEQDAIFACIHAAGKTKHPGGKDWQGFDEADFAIADGIVEALVAQHEQEAETPQDEQSQQTKESVEPEIYEDDKEDEGVKAKWSTSQINDLPDSCFLYIKPGGKKDEEGKTVPRSLRMFPYKNADGEIDLPHLRNALARLGQPRTDVPESVRKRLIAKARRLLERETSDEDEEKETDEKIGRRISKAVMVALADIKDRVDSILRHGEYADEEDEDEKKEVALKTIERDGQTYLVIWPTNAFIDRENEIFTTKAIAEYVERHRADPIKGELRYRHWKATKFGDIVWQGMSGRFLVEVGVFDDTPAGQAFKELFTKYPNGHPVVSPEGWGTSHGYKYRQEDRADAVYEWFDKEETSVLPARVAANPHNPTVEVIMDKKAMDELIALVGEDVAKQIDEQGRRLTEEKEKAGVAHKETIEAPATETPAADPEKAETDAGAEKQPAGIPEVVAAVVKELHLDELATAFKAQADAIATLTKELEDTKKRLAEVERDDEQRIAEKEASLPAWPWSRAFRPSQADATKIGDDDAIKARLSRNVPPAVAGIAAAIGGN